MAPARAESSERPGPSHETGGRLRSSVGARLLVLGLIGVSPGFAAEPDEELRKEIEALKQGQANMQRQLNEIKRLIQQQQKQNAAARPARQGPKVKDVVFSLGSNEVKGDKSAQLTRMKSTLILKALTWRW